METGQYMGLKAGMVGELDNCLASPSSSDVLNKYNSTTSTKCHIMLTSAYKHNKRKYIRGI